MPSISVNVADFLLGGKDPARVALRMLDRDHTYGDLQSESSRVAAFLASTGRKKGDRVVLAADNSLFWVASYLGILQAGLICVPIPTGISAEQFDFILQTTECRLVFAQARFAAMNGDRLPHLEWVTDREVPNRKNAFSFQQLPGEIGEGKQQSVERESNDLAALMFTSGSTGTPRGVMVSHGNIIANTQSIAQYLHLTPDDRIMTVLPFHYCFGTSLLHSHLSVGASLVIDPRFMYPEKVLERMLETACTGFAGVPSHFQILLRKSSLARKHFPNLRYVQQAGGHLAPTFIHELRKALPGSKIFVMYGQTEATARLAYVPPEHLETKASSIGKAIPGVTLRVLCESGAEVEPGQIGEIVAEGPNVAQGYWREPEESAKCFRDGKLYTGDMGTIDDDGFFYVLDRAKDFIKCGGKRVSCRQIEETLLEFEELLEAAVVGIKDEILGEAVKAYVVPRDSNSQELAQRTLDFCKEHLSHQLVPKEIVVMNSLPKNSAGKVLKQKLKTEPQFSGTPDRHEVQRANA
jgi:long-chain acyl-CoA synthetase